jgi:hypothetical protein
MPEYRVEWRKKPFANHNANVLFVEAANPNDAKLIVIDHVEREHGISHGDFAVSGETHRCGAIVETKPVPHGKVK